MRSKVKLKGRLKSYMIWPLLLTILLVVINIVAYTMDVRSGLLFSVFTAVYFLVVLTAYFYHKPAILYEMVNFATQYGVVQKHLLDDFGVPYALMDRNGKILWANKKFAETTGKDKDCHKSVESIFPNLTKTVLQQEGDHFEREMSLGDRYYRAVVDKIYFDGPLEENEVISVDEGAEFLAALLLFDETLLHQYRSEIQEQRLVCGLVYIDNYEEAMKSIEEVKRSLLEALVDRKVNKYFNERDALVKKLEKDKYFIAFKQKYLKEMIADRFSLIEDIKTIKVGNEMAVTLSIGIGVGAGDYNQKYDYARMAMDLALGRGGDQVVVKEGQKVSYYGGKSQQVEKTTRVKARVKAHALREIIETRDRVLVMGHSISDADAFGASIAIYCAARELGKRAYIVINEVSSSLRPLKEQFTPERGYPEDMFVNSEKALDLVDNNSVVMVVDTNRPSHTDCPELLNRTRTIVVFDHHRQSSEVIENAVLSYIETYASSTCEMVAEVLQYFSENVRLQPREADCIYAGILIDTQNFNIKAGVRTFEAAAYLRRCGAEVTRVRKLLRDDMNAYKARAEVARQAKVFHGAFAISICPSSGLESPTIVGAQAANELLNIVGIKASFVLTEYNGKIYISSRSIDEINVQLIMERMGGGGHINMAGTQLQDCSMEQAIRMLERTIEDMLREGEIEV